MQKKRLKPEAEIGNGNQKQNREIQTKYANAVEGGELKMYATECSGEFVSGVGMSEPVAKNGFAILPPPECK